MSTISRIYSAIQRHDIAETDKMDLKRGLEELRQIKKVLKSSWWAFKPPGPSKSRIPDHRKSPYGVMIDGIRCCKGCKFPIPHVTKEDWKRHWLLPHYRARYRQIQPYLAKCVANRIAANYRRALVNRIRILEEMAPRATALMSQADKERIVASVRNTPGRALSSYIQLRYFIARTYGNDVGWKDPRPNRHQRRRKRLTPPSVVG
jgi:hypothetical protein